MDTLLMGMLAETFVHVGGGQSEGVVDLPVAREAATDFPFVPGSGLKGAFRDWAAGRMDDSQRDTWFGQQDNAGQLLFSDARLLALPVRSLHGASRWITCPHLLERYRRDATRTGSTMPSFAQDLKPGQALGEGEGRIILEERGFELVGQVPADIVQAFLGLPAHEDTRERMAEALVILHDDDFTWFARYGLAVQARNALDNKTKTSKSLWYEETLPPDSLLYALIGSRGNGGLEKFHETLKTHPYVQVGGNETIGQGWMALAFPEAAS